MKTIDLRSDTVTRPTQAMRDVMARAEVGDDVFGDDPTVNALQEKTAALVGMEAAIFLPSGTQSNLCALMAHCGRGDEYIVGQNAHTYKYEGGGAAVLGSIQPQPIENASDGTIPLERIRAAVKPDDAHFAVTRLIALENTIGGMVIPQAYVDEVAQFARASNLALHLDGARLFNAVVKSGKTAEELCAPFDSVSVCLSKGLGAPAGSVLCGTKALIGRAHRIRKMLGGGMRQAGIIAAAGIHALDHHVARLAEDHANAKALADGLNEVASLKVTMPQTNIVFVDVPSAEVQALQTHLAAARVIAIVGPRTRLVTHLDVTREDLMRVVELFRQFFAKRG
ncbi:MAG: low-specificity L-threonine aldolase [Burkholderiales bacterium]